METNNYHWKMWKNALYTETLLETEFNWKWDETFGVYWPWNGAIYGSHPTQIFGAKL